MDLTSRPFDELQLNALHDCYRIETDASAVGNAALLAYLPR